MTQATTTAWLAESLLLAPSLPEAISDITGWPVHPTVTWSTSGTQSTVSYFNVCVTGCHYVVP